MLPSAVLFACAMNAVRSPMAAALMRRLTSKGIYVESAGVRVGAPGRHVLPFRPARSSLANVTGAMRNLGITAGSLRRSFSTNGRLLNPKPEP